MDSMATKDATWRTAGQERPSEQPGGEGEGGEPYLHFLCPGVEAFPEQPPARKAVPVVAEVGLILAAHIDGNDRSGTHVARDVSYMGREEGQRNGNFWGVEHL